MSHDNGERVLIALGSRFRGDDGIGPFVAERLKPRLTDCAVVEGAGDALAIINAWECALLTVVVDAASSGAPPGTIHRLEIGKSPLPKDLARCSSHGVGLYEALELARVLGRMPDRLVIYAVEAKTFAQGAPLSPEVAHAAERVVRDVEAELASLARA